ncbi:MAG: class I SAM-dependent methyltransferase [Akkermansiaceae bacterium]|nr:class I SAM-dependent methyltransferase [Akkermansiaceae bacterium]
MRVREHMDEGGDLPAAGCRIQTWAAHAAHWNRLGPPLRPCREDLDRMVRAWTDSLPAGIPSRRVDVLSLGVTPEFAAFRWAPETSITAIDSSGDMIRAVWPGEGPHRRAVQGDWLQTPFADESFDLAVCDAGLTQLAAEHQVKALGRELRRVLRPDGRVVMRHFAGAEDDERIEDLVASAETGGVGSFHELKLRLLFAMAHGDPGRCVRLGDAWTTFERLFPDRPRLASRLGCAPEIVGTIDAYRDRDAHYAFPPLREVAQAFESFDLQLGPRGDYPLAERCPVFSLTPRP